MSHTMFTFKKSKMNFPTPFLQFKNINSTKYQEGCFKIFGDIWNSLQQILQIHSYLLIVAVVFASIDDPIIVSLSCTFSL